MAGKLSQRERAKATQQYQARSRVTVQIPPACSCAAHPFAHYHIERLKEYDAEWERAYGEEVPALRGEI